jgi:predicted cupin superfamily sugar epimerase
METQAMAADSFTSREGEGAHIDAEAVIRRLDLKPHPEGGHYRETYRDPVRQNERSVSTAIYFLLRQGERSHWYRVDAAEIWHWYAGAPLMLRISAGAEASTLRLGTDFARGEQPQAIVPAGAWQSAESLGAWTLVGCTVAPGFEFGGFELAPPGWSPPG